MSYLIKLYINTYYTVKNRLLYCIYNILGLEGLLDSPNYFIKNKNNNGGV